MKEVNDALSECVEIMKKQDKAKFKMLFSAYCRERMGAGHCDDCACDHCAVDTAYDEIFNGSEDADDESLTTGLYKKVFEAQETYREEITSHPVEKILDEEYFEYYLRQDILVYLEENDLEDAEASVLLKAENPLEDILYQYRRVKRHWAEDVLTAIQQAVKAKAPGGKNE